MLKQPGLAAIVYFALGKADLTANASEIVKAWGRYLKENPNKKVEVGGHTDNLGSEVNNLLLSKRRADAVEQRMVREGAKPEQVLRAYFGYDRPLEPNEPEKGNPKNRRVEIKVVE